jgi:hypothetical protein
VLFQLNYHIPEALLCLTLKEKILTILRDFARNSVKFTAGNPQAIKVIILTQWWRLEAVKKLSQTLTLSLIFLQLRLKAAETLHQNISVQALKIFLQLWFYIVCVLIGKKKAFPDAGSFFLKVILQIRIIKNIFTILWLTLIMVIRLFIKPLSREPQRSVTDQTMKAAPCSQPSTTP